MPGDPFAVIHRYFTALDSGDYAGALECFSDDVFYSRPPLDYTPGARRPETRGKAALAELFEARKKHPRGKHVVPVCIGEGQRAFIRGTQTLPGQEPITFVSEVGLDDAGLIRYYAAYVAIPPVGTMPEQLESPSASSAS
jgi:hypothetical protein